ncbi:hypothetical protein N7470_010369 [Penicillium chermesinum]|nr:hypothetical protein N7470_010369 [Penicillium chermesinum]
MSTLLPFRDERLPLAASTYHHDPLVFIDRQTKYIQRSLQTFIDAQGEGLLSGLGHTQTDGPSDGSDTPTSSRASRTLSPTSSSRKLPPRKIGLRTARERIFQSIYDLLKLREEEHAILSSQIDERDTALREIESFTAKRRSLEEAISAIHNGRDTQRAKSLRKEAHTLETDILELETRLYEMKARHRHLIGEISDIENSVDAKLSSYNESLSLLQSDNPPVKPLSQRVNESTFYALNPERRTLAIAQDHWKHEQQEIQQRQQKVDAEIVALEEGGGVWKRAIADVSGFEKKLVVYMRRYTQLSAQEEDGAPIGDSKEECVEGPGRCYPHLQSYLARAEDQNWKLLVCCISAELEALRLAKRLLLPAFGITDSEEPSAGSSGQTLQGPSSDHLDEPQHRPESALENDNPEPPSDLLKDEDHHADNASRSEDDEPDPSWLLET